MAADELNVKGGKPGAFKSEAKKQKTVRFLNDS